jgi:hypothetical protein
MKKGDAKVAFFDVWILFLVPELLLGNPLLAKLCFATCSAKERPGKKDPLGPGKEKQELLILGVPKRELGNEFNCRGEACLASTFPGPPTTTKAYLT